jgi:hypothetical protein
MQICEYIPFIANRLQNRRVTLFKQRFPALSLHARFRLLTVMFRRFWMFFTPMLHIPRRVFLPPALLRSDKFMILGILSPRSPIGAFALGLAFLAGTVFLIAGTGEELSSATRTLFRDK